jgi:hypothetical protein
MEGVAIWSTADRELLRLLFEAECAISIYLLHEKYHLRPVEILISLRKFDAIGIVEVNFDEMCMSMSESGRLWVVLHRREIFLTPVDMPWKAPPPSYTRRQTLCLDSYVPKRKYLSAKFFEALATKD